MRWLILLVAGLVLATPAAAEPMIIAHRGNDGSAPENTLAAFRGSIGRGVMGIETDIRATRDGELVLMHDKTVDRTTDGSGSVTRLTLAEIRKLDAGSGQAVPTLREALRLVRGTRTSLLLDMKPGTPLDAVLDLVRSEKAESSVVFGLRSAAQAEILRRLAPGVRVAALMRSYDDLPDFEAAGVRIMRLWSHWIDPANGGNPKVVAEVKARGHKVWCIVGKDLPRTENDWKAAHARLAAMGVDAITTDRPDLWAGGLHP